MLFLHVSAPTQILILISSVTNFTSNNFSSLVFQSLGGSRVRCPSVALKSWVFDLAGSASCGVLFHGRVACQRPSKKWGMHRHFVGERVKLQFADECFCKVINMDASPVKRPLMKTEAGGGV